MKLKHIFLMGIIISFNFLCVNAHEIKMEDSPSPKKINGSLFVVKKSGSVRGVLFGTIHVGYKGIKELPKKVAVALKESDIFYREADVDNEVEMQQCGPDKLFELPSNKTLKNILKLNTYLELTRYLDKEKFSESQKESIEKLTPFGLVMTLEGRNPSPEFDGSKSLDELLDDFALTEKIRISGLETPCESMSGLNTVNREEWDSYVRKFLELLNCKSCTEDMNRFSIEFVHLIMMGEVDQAAELYKSNYSRKINVFEEQQKIYLSRNVNMANKIAKLADKNEIFFVSVGALHLGGKNGVNQRLRNMGFEIEQIR